MTQSGHGAHALGFAQLIFIKQYFVGTSDVLFGAIVEALLTLCARSLHLVIQTDLLAA
jgi:hypothetical protein